MRDCMQGPQNRVSSQSMLVNAPTLGRVSNFSCDSERDKKSKTDANHLKALHYRFFL
jgi:hypothetical protein